MFGFDDSRIFKHKVMPRADLDALLGEYRRLADEHGAESSQALAVRNHIVVNNMRLVHSLAARYRAPRGWDDADVRGYGVAGLIKAVERFDLKHGTTFSTYAGWWIRHSIGRAIDDLGLAVRVPVHLTGKKTTAKPELRVAAAQARDVWSLNAPINTDDGPRTLGDVVADKERVDVLDKMAAEQDAERVRRALASLPPRLRAVVELRYLGDACQTLYEVGDAMGYSRERVRQLELDAFAIMRKELALP